jgi:LAO/AO transport system kinase
LATQAKRVQADYTAALRTLRHDHRAWQPRVLTVSAQENRGIAEVWAAVEEFSTILGGSGQLEAKRSDQALSWMWKDIRSSLMDTFRNHPETIRHLPAITAQVRAGTLAPGQAATKLLEKVLV